MKEIVDWLVSIEQMTRDIYRKAAELFKADKDFHRFLIHLAEDEKAHYQLMKRVKEYFQGHEIPPSAIGLDQQAKQRIEKPLMECLNTLSTGAPLSKDIVLDYIVTVEFSELNYLFIYVIKHMPKESSEFIYPATLIQNHLRYLEHFLGSLPEGEKHLESVRRFPEVLKENILIVEDDSAIAELLGVLLQREGKITIAQNGAEGLRKVKKNYYRLILSDIGMPVMDGMEFFKNASRIYPNIAERFLFFTGDLNADRIAFFDKNHLNYLSKPALVNEIYEKVIEIMSKVITLR